jgi:hypothetical protein
MARLDVDIKLWRDKLILETAAGYTVQRGKMTADYTGTNNYYICTGNAPNPPTGDGSGCVEGELVTFPYDEINQLIENLGGDPTQVSDFVGQESLSVGTVTASQSASSEILDLEIGIRYNFTHWFDLSLGFRSSYYSDMGLDLIPQDVATSVSGAVVVPSVRAKTSSVTYEGFYLGLRFSFF